MMGVGLVLLYFGLALAAAAIILQSDRYAVKRSATIAASARKLFELASDTARWGSLGAASVVESRPDEFVALRLVSGSSESVATIELRPEGGKMVVECVVAGRNTIGDKAKNLLSGREQSIGPKIDRALADLAASA